MMLHSAAAALDSATLIDVIMLYPAAGVDLATFAVFVLLPASAIRQDKMLDDVEFFWC